MDTPSLLDILQLEQIEQDIYRAQLVLAEQYSLYGGQVAAQALLAAGLTVDAERLPHSLHGYFLRPGKDDAPTILRVDRIRDGRSFTTRTCSGSPRRPGWRSPGGPRTSRRPGP